MLFYIKILIVNLGDKQGIKSCDLIAMYSCSVKLSRSHCPD